MSLKTLAPFVLLALAGCGGNGGSGVEERTLSLSPDKTTLAPGESTTLVLSQRGYKNPVLGFTVVEGTSGGTLTGDGADARTDTLTRTYTAPGAPGTYHVRGGLIERPSGVERYEEVTFTVVAAQS